MNTGELKLYSLLCGKCRRVVCAGQPKADYYWCPKCREQVENPGALSYSLTT